MHLMLDPSYDRLHPNARIVWILGGLIGVGILMLVGAGVEFGVLHNRRDWPWPPMIPLMSLCGGVLLAIASVVASILRFSRFGYQLRDADLVVASGVLWRVRRCIPRARVQHIGIESGPIDRMFGLVNVEVFVAGGMGPVAQIGGLSPEAAEQLKEALIVERAVDGV